MSILGSFSAHKFSVVRPGGLLQLEEYMAGMAFVQDQGHVDQKRGSQPKESCSDTRILAMKYARSSPSSRIAEGLLAAGCTGIQFGPFANDNTTRFTVGGTATVQGPHLGRTGGVLGTGGVRKALDLNGKWKKGNYNEGFSIIQDSPHLPCI